MEPMIVSRQIVVGIDPDLDPIVAVFVLQIRETQCDRAGFSKPSHFHELAIEQ